MRKGPLVVWANSVTRPTQTLDKTEYRSVCSNTAISWEPFFLVSPRTLVHKLLSVTRAISGAHSQVSATFGLRSGLLVGISDTGAS